MTPQKLSCAAPSTTVAAPVVVAAVVVAVVTAVVAVVATVEAVADSCKIISDYSSSATTTIDSPAEPLSKVTIASVALVTNSS